MRTGYIVVRGEFGHALTVAIPGSRISVVDGHTHIEIPVRDEPELFGVPERLRDLGAELVSVRFSS